MNSLTVNLHLLMVSFYRPTGTRTKIVIEDTAFPSDSYAVRSQARFHGLDPDATVVRLDPADVLGYLAHEGHEVALVLLGGVSYLTGELMDIPAITRARARGPARWSAGTWRTPPGTSAGAARMGPRLRGLVLLQVPERGTGRARRRVRARAAPRRPGGPAVRGLVEHRTGDPLRDGAGLPSPGDGRRLAGLQPADLRDGPGPHLPGDLRPRRHGRAAGPEHAPHRLPGSAARRAPDHRGDPARSRPEGQPALPARRRAAAPTSWPDGCGSEFGVITDAREPDIVRAAPVPLYCTYHDCWRAGRRPRARHRGGPMSDEIAVVGAGLAGCLLACFLARRGLRVALYERRPDPRTGTVERGRSINLALSERGLDALRRIGLDKQVMADALPMRGRVIHPVQGELDFQPYSHDGQRAINSISRSALNNALLTAAADQPGVPHRLRPPADRPRPANGRDDVPDPGGRRPGQGGRGARGRRRGFGGAGPAAGARRADREPRTSSTTATRSCASRRATASSPSPRTRCTSGRAAPR